MNAESESRGTNRIPELDGWRAVSVLTVVFDHTITYKQVNLHSYALSRMVMLAGHLGVSVFFVISGFVICRLFILEERKFGSVSLRAFYYRRIFRILPPLYAFLATIALMMAAGLIIGKWDALPVAATFLYDLAQVPVNWFVAHTWSLAVEEQFYLVFPILWVLTPARWRSGAVAATFLLCIVWSLAYGYSATSIQIGPIPRWGFAAISVGVWAAINERWVRQAAARVPAFCIGLVALLLIIRPVHTDAHFAYQSFNAAVLPLGIGLVLMYSLERGRWLRAALCSKPMQAVGVTSYGIYLWQQTFTGPTADYTSRGAPIGFMLPLLLIVIPASYFFLEKPAMRFGKTLSQRVREKASAKAGASA